jgi:predicted acyltransferase
MGLYTVNQEAYGGGDGMLSRTMFSILMVIGFFLVWNAYPKSDGWKKYLFTGMQIVGAALLVWLALSFVDRDGGGFGIRWWGILGRIGWTYLFCCIAYVVIGKRMWWHLGLTAVLVVLSILQSEQLIPGWLANHYTIYAFGMSGVSLSMLLQRYADRSNPKRFYLIMLLIGVGMLIAGFVAHPHWIISKLSATPTWYFFCCAIFFPLFGLIYMITDVKGKTLWFNLVKPAGTAALSCYVLAYAFPIKSISLSNLLMRPEFSDGILGLFNLLCYALLLIWTVWLLGKVYIRLKV